MNDYAKFLEGKHVRQSSSGISVDESSLNNNLFPWQKKVVSWALRKGRAAIWEDCGLGKTIQQLEWSRLVCERHGGRVLLLCPLAVQWQTAAEAKKFGIADSVHVSVCENQEQASADVPANGIVITNYEKLHHFDATGFSGVVLDESSVLKNYTGVTKRALCERFSNTPYRLACTATPAPNDRMELGNHAEFLGIMPSNEMLSRWFINDGGKAGTYRLRKHGERDFWRWMASWAVCISTPADLGFPGDGYHLPPLVTTEHVIDCKPDDGWLFAVPKDISATDVHREKRAYLAERSDVVAGLVNSDMGTWAVWCDTDYEADALCDRIPDAVEVRGSETNSAKERKLRGFSAGDYRVIVTKAEIAGHGLNWQHCHKTTWFAGYSWERFYQAIRRLLRYGQLSPVELHLVRTVSEESILDTINAKQASHDQMHREMASLMADGMMEELGLAVNRPRKYEADSHVILPKFLKQRQQETYQ